MAINLLEGKVVAPEGMKVGIIASRFNSFIVQKLLDGAVDGLVRHGVEESNIDAAWVPGAFEVPLMAQKMAESGKYDAVICVGAVIRGATSHYELVTNESAKGIAQVSLKSGVTVPPFVKPCPGWKSRGFPCRRINRTTASRATWG